MPPSEFAKHRAPLIKPVLDTAAKMHDAVIDFQTAVVALAEHAERMRKMSDEVQGYSRALDGTDGTAIMELPRIIIPARKEAAE
jgi:vacuolar-type H+-ATPase subunit D/Vma8